jgi:hypothetical protein
MKALHSVTLAIFLSGVGTGATIVQMQNFSFVPDGTAPLTFNQFDTSLGTLTTITIVTNVVKTGGSLFVDNESAFPASGNISQSVTINLTSSVALIDSGFGPIGTGVSAVSTYAASVGADDGDGAGVQSTGLDYDGTSFGPASNSQTKNVNTLAFGGYQGIGTYVVNAGGVQGFNTSAIGGAAVAIDPATVSGDVTITYTYTPVPEPSAALLGGIGFLALLRRRRY